MPQAARANARNSLKGLRVLCVCGDGDDEGLEAVLATATRELGWQVETTRPDVSRFTERQAFEDDENAVVEVDALIRACECAGDVPAGRILLAGDRDLGRGFSVPDVQWPESAVGGSVLADNFEAFRILRRIFAHARDTMGASKPELVLLGGRADPWTFVFRLVANNMGVDALALRRSRLWDGRCYWTDDPAGLNVAARKVVAQKSATHASVSTLAQNRIAESRLPQAASPGAGANARYSPEGLANLHYIYLPLKEDPSTAPDSQSPFWASQYYLAELVCSTVPAGYKLLIQDHPDNSGRRPARFYRDLARLPSVVLIDAAEEARPYINHAALVITDDSPAGWQALLLGRPVIALTDSFYTASDLAQRLHDPEQLGATVLRVLAPTLVRDAANDPRKLGWLLDAEWETTAARAVPGESLRLLELSLRKSAAPSANAATGNGEGRHVESFPRLRRHDAVSAGFLQGQRVLAVLPLGSKDLGKYLTGLMAAGKDRFGWRVSVLSSTADTRSFAKVVAPQGEIFVQPPLLREAEWESDPHAAHDVDRAIRAAETKTGMPLGQVILAAGHSIGRAYSAPYLYFNRYPMLLRVLRDNEEPHRVARRLFRFADDMLERDKPDFLFFFHWGTPLNLLTWLAAQRRGIPCVVLRPSKIRHDHAFLTTDRLMWNTRAAEHAQAKINAKAPVSTAAQEKLRTFRNQPVMIGHISRKWSNRTNLGFLRWHKQYVRIVMTQVANRFRGQDRASVEGVFARFARYYRTVFLSWYQQRMFATFEPPVLADMKYVYFPMHKEAEMAQLLQTTVWHDQRQTIRTLASALPFGYRLLVREHRMNYGRRRSQAYRELARLPNVTLIDPFDSQFKYLQHADLVVTENGSSGWESLMLKRPTLLLAEHTFYAGSGLGTTVTDPDALHAAVLDLLSKPRVADEDAYDHALAAMIDAEFESTFLMKPEGTGACLDRLAALLAPLQSENAPPARVAVNH
jgi:CDP-glycerol glycerophosphotransferase (TagB/SpsB family)